MLSSYFVAAVLGTSTIITTPIDSDNDGLSDIQEMQLGTLLDNDDSDGDGYKDMEEIMSGYNPLNSVHGNRKVDKRIEINLSKQQLHYYFNNVRIGSYYVSTGRLSAKTPTGTFGVLRKVPVKHYLGLNVSYPNTKWNLEFKKGYYIHSAYWHDDFGVKPRSGGCINLTVPDATQMYRFLDVGDRVIVYGKTPTQPLQKPLNIEISHQKSAPVL